MCVGLAHVLKKGKQKMKKLLVLAAVIVASVAANAASFKWTGANIYGSDITTKYTGTAAIYAYLNTATVADAVKVTDVFVVGGIIKSDSAGTATGYTYNWSDAVGNSTYQFYMVLEDGGKTFNSSTSDPAVIKSGLAAATATTSVIFGNMQSATQNASNWQSVPEPTSGLLMLLGMAGLALRRRRA